MLLIDEAKAVQHSQIRKRENYREHVAKWVEEQTAQCQFVDNGEIAALDAGKKMGRVMMTRDFETRLSKLLPGITFVGRNGFKGRKAKYPYGQGEHLEIGPYNADFLSERTIREPWVTEIPVDSDGLRDVEKPIMHIDMGQVPEYDWTPIDSEEMAQSVGLTLKQAQALWEPDGRGCGYWKERGPSWRVGSREVVVPGRIMRMGWRSLLVRCVKGGLLSPSQVEQNFGVDNTPEWKQHMGRTNGVVLVPC